MASSETLTTTLFNPLLSSTWQITCPAPYSLSLEAPVNSLPCGRVTYL